MRLRLVAEADAHREAPRHAHVVLDVAAELHVGVVDERVAAALREGRRASGLVGVEARERERPAHVPRVVAAIAAGFEQEARARRMASLGVVDVGGELDVGAAASALDLRAAGGEGVEHLQRRRVGERRRLARLVAQLEARLVEEVPANRARLRQAEDILRGVARVGARGEVVVADAQVPAGACRCAGSWRAGCATWSARDRRGPRSWRDRQAGARCRRCAARETPRSGSSSRRR